MGFIKYHGPQENHYEDLVGYTKIQDEIERQKRDEQKKQVWISEFTGNPRYASLDASASLKLAVKAYHEAADCYRRISANAQNGEEDSLQLWQDLWLECTYRCISAMQLPEDKSRQLMNVLTTKLLKLEGKTLAEQHLTEMQGNPQYRRYITKSFSLDGKQVPKYWKWLGRTSSNKTELTKLIRSCGQYYLFLSYYLYKSSHPPDDNWISLIERNRANTNRIISQVTKDTILGAAGRKPENPLYSKGFPQKLPVYIRVLLFQRQASREQIGDMQMIEDLYEYLSEGDFPREAPESILPENVSAQIREGKLPVFENASVGGLQPGEKIHYLNHMILYQEDIQNGSYTVRNGRLIVTDRRIAFRSANVGDIPLEQLERILRYDLKPEILELQSADRSVLLTVPDPDEAYQVLRMIANKDSERTVSSVPVPLSYEQLVEKADLGACIFALNCLEAYSLPEELTAKIALLVKKLWGLHHAVEAHPEHRQDIDRFLEYYVPEAVRLLTSYDDYQASGLDEKTLQKTRRLITDAIDTLDAAAEQQIMSIYQMQSMETRAKADALRQVLEQDGYYKGNQILKH